VSFFRIHKGVIVMKASNSALSSRSRWSGRSASVAVLAVVAACSALLAAGCGGGSSGAGVAQIDTTKSGTTGQKSGGSGKRDPAAYSACMRKNGVPNFPDPDSNGNIKITGGRDSHGGTFGIDANSSQFRKAQKACRKLQPNGSRPSPQEQARMQQQALKFSQCMRSHGVPKFPDPQFSPNGGTLMRIGQDVNPNSPQFKAAQKACQKLVPGGPLSGAPPPSEKP
jgi:hypothetical protein